MAVTNNLKKIRLQKHISQKELADGIGSCSRTISRIERGERNPSLEVALLIAEFLKVKVEEVFQLDM